MKNVKKIFIAVAVLFLNVCPLFGSINFNDGLTHDINYKINDYVYVDYKAPDMHTTVNLLDGGSVKALHSYNSGQVNVSGGSSAYIETSNSSRLSISGGSLLLLISYDYSQVNFTGGIIDVNVASLNSSQINIFGGLIGNSLTLFDQSIIQIFGSDFAVDGQPVGYGELTSIHGGDPWQDPLRHLTGTLLSGEFIDNDFYIGHHARIVLTTPEPTTVLLLGLGGIFVRKKKTLCAEKK